MKPALSYWKSRNLFRIIERARGTLTKNAPDALRPLFAMKSGTASCLRARNNGNQKDEGFRGRQLIIAIGHASPFRHGLVEIYKKFLLGLR